MTEEEKLLDETRRKNLHLLVRSVGTQSDFAKRIGKSRSYIAQLLNGKQITAQYARYIEKKLKLKEHYLDTIQLHLIKEEDSLDDDIKILIEKMKRLSKESRSKILDYAKIHEEAERFRDSALD